MTKRERDRLWKMIREYAEAYSDCDMFLDDDDARERGAKRRRVRLNGELRAMLDQLTTAD